MSTPSVQDGFNADNTPYSSAGAPRYYKLTSNGSVEATQAMVEGLYRFRFDSATVRVGKANIGAAVGASGDAAGGFIVAIDTDAIVKIEAGGETLHFLGAGDLYCTRVR